MLYLVNGQENRQINCADDPLPYFPRLIADIADRTETAVGQVVGMVLHQRAEYDIALRTGSGQHFCHPVQPGGGAAAGEPAGVGIGIRADKTQYFGAGFR